MTDYKDSKVFQQPDTNKDFFDTVDSHKFIPKPFTQDYEIEAPEWGDLHQKRDEFIRLNAGKYQVEEVEIPESIPGLVRRTPNTMRLPSTRYWWRKTGSFERNGFFNIHTHVFNTKSLYWGFLLFLGYGWVQGAISGMYQENEYDNYETRQHVYDKLGAREVPLGKVWSRPS